MMFLFAKRLKAFLVPIKDINPKERAEAIKKWEEDDNYKGKVGETLLVMIQRCDDSVKAGWLSKLVCELVLKRNFSRLFMRAEKTLLSLSVMDLQAFLNMQKDACFHISEEESEPFLGSGLYQSSHLEEPVNGNIDLDAKYCELSEIGIWIYNVLNDISVPNVIEPQQLF